MRLRNLFLMFLVTYGFNINSQTKSWDGGSTANDYWHTDCNWNPDGVPACTDIVTIPTSNNVIIQTGIIAHCEVLNLQGNSTLDIQGTGKLEVSDVNACVGTKSTASAGCSVPGSSFSHNGNNHPFIPCFSKYCICPCVNTGSDTRTVTITNNTSFDITITGPTATVGCGTWSKIPASGIATANGGTVLIRLTANFSCCPANWTYTFNWTSTDTYSGSFTVEACNIL